MGGEGKQGNRQRGEETQPPFRALRRPLRRCAWCRCGVSAASCHVLSTQPQVQLKSVVLVADRTNGKVDFTRLLKPFTPGEGPASTNAGHDPSPSSSSASLPPQPVCFSRACHLSDPHSSWRPTALWACIVGVIIVFAILLWLFSFKKETADFDPSFSEAKRLGHSFHLSLQSLMGAALTNDIATPTHAIYW